MDLLGPSTLGWIGSLVVSPRRYRYCYCYRYATLYIPPLRCYCMQGREELRQRLLDHDRRRGGQAGTPPGRQRVLLHSRVLASFISELQGYISALHESSQLCPQTVLDRLDYCLNLEAELTGSYVPQRHSPVAPVLPESDVGPQLYPSDIATLIATPAPPSSNLT